MYWSHASFNTMRYKGRDSASESVSTADRVDDDERAYKSNFQGEKNGRREQPNTDFPEHTIVSSILTDLVFKKITEEDHLDQYRRTHH